MTIYGLRGVDFMELIMWLYICWTGADIASSSSWEDLTDGQKNIDPPEPEWPGDRPIKPGDILYMMFHRPENDKEVKEDKEIDDKDDKPSLIK